MAKTPCPACSGRLRAGDEFCESCGAPVDPATQAALERRAERKRARDAARDEAGAEDRAIIRRRLDEAARKASRIIAGIAVLTLLGGLLFYALARDEANKALGLLAGLDPDTTIPEKINGVTYTVRELREKVAAEPFQALLVNLALAAVFAGLYLWARRGAVYAAMLTAAAVFCVVHFVAFTIDPKSLLQGIIVKILIVSALVKGIRTAKEARDHARGAAEGD